MSEPGGITRTTPPLDSLRRVSATLERAGITAALGGSGLAAALGHPIDVHDWDLTTDAPLDQVSAALTEFEQRRYGSSGIHADAKLTLLEGEVEVIVGFAMRSGDGVVRLPTIVTGAWNDVPLGSPEVWVVAYALLGRAESSERLMRYLKSTGARPEIVQRLLEQPVPDPVRSALVSLLRGADAKRPG